MTSMVLIIAAIFVVVPIFIAVIAMVVIKSARRKDGSVDWWDLGKNNSS